VRLIGLAVILTASLTLAPFAADAQGPARVPRIGYLVFSPLVDPPSAERQAFLDGLRDLGYVVGRTLVIEYRSAAWNREFLPDLAAELVDRKVDIIVAVPGAIEAARDATKTIPIVVPSLIDPVDRSRSESRSAVANDLMAQVTPLRCLARWTCGSGWSRRTN